MLIVAVVGSKALYLLFLWLISAATAAWMSERKGYTERVGLIFGLLLTVVGLAIVVLLPGRPGSAWREEGPLPRRRARRPASAAAGPPPVATPPDADGGSADGPPAV